MKNKTAHRQKFESIRAQPSSNRGQVDIGATLAANGETAIAFEPREVALDASASASQSGFLFPALCDRVVHHVEPTVWMVALAVVSLIGMAVRFFCVGRTTASAAFSIVGSVGPSATLAAARRAANGPPCPSVLR